MTRKLQPQSVSYGLGWSSAQASDSAEGEITRLPPEATVSAIVLVEKEVFDGSVIHTLEPAWREIERIARTNPEELYRLSPRQWEEIIAAGYDRAGFDEVILTPRSGDLGRDVIAAKRGRWSVRIIDQVKAYKPGHLVTADEVRSLLGVLHADPAATKGVVTTTSKFAPKITEDRLIAPFCPYRLELIDGPKLFRHLLQTSEDGVNRPADSGGSNGGSKKNFP